MSDLPSIKGIEELTETGRNSFSVSYRGRLGGAEMLVEVLTEDTDANRNEFFRTTALQSRLGHPGMPPIAFSGLTEKGPFRAKQRIEGQPVSSLFTGGPISKERLIGTARALSSTLDALHRRGMTHTEIHPHGLRVDSSGLVRFVDTGRACPVGRPLPKFERSLALPYSAPECKEGAPSRLESDVYSLGAVLVALAAGKPVPSSGISSDFLRDSSKQMSPALRVLLRSMLHKDPSARPEAQTIADCISKIDQLDVLLKLKSWKPEPSSKSYLGQHPYSLIGRDKELGQLMGLWQRAGKGQGTSVTILGPKGTGRRRLVEELRRGVLRSGGTVVRHALDAVSDQPTLIINHSHRGRHTQSPDNPWLSINFAETGPVPDQHIIELEALPEGDCIRLAESYLSASLEPALQEEIFSRGPLLPSVLLAQLDQWSEEGVLQPTEGRWRFSPSEGLPVNRDASTASKNQAHKEIKIDYDQALKTVVELWSTSLRQDDPMVSILGSFCKALKCERADLYQIVEGKAKYVCASSFGRHRLRQELTEEVMLKVEPVWSGSTLLFPLRCGATFCGFLSLQWWEAGVPRFDTELFRMLAMAGSPLALTLGQAQLEDRRLKRITEALEELLKATSEPADIMTRLAQSLRKSFEFDVLSAWINRKSTMARLFSDPPGSQELDGTEHVALLFAEPFEPRQHGTTEDDFLALPLIDGTELLGGLIISRDPSIGFNEVEVGWAVALTKVGESALRNVREIGSKS